MPNETHSLQPRDRKAPDLSVVIISWNTRELLRDCLTSVFSEPTGLTLEVFVADNASSDGSAEMVRDSFPQVQLIQNETNLGFAAANNRIFPLCHADKILLLNSDTVVIGNALRVLVDCLDRHREAGAVAPKLNQTGAGIDILGCGELITLRTSINHWLFLARMFPRVRAFEGIYHYAGAHDDITREVGWVSGACMLVRRAAIEQVGPLSERWFMYAEDQEWCARMKDHEWKIYHVPEAVVEHRHGASFNQNPEVSVLPLKAIRGLFIHLNRPSPAQLLVHDWILTLGLMLRGLGEFLRSIAGQPDLRELRRNRSKKFLADARLTAHGLGPAED